MAKNIKNGRGVQISEVGGVGGGATLPTTTTVTTTSTVTLTSGSAGILILADTTSENITTTIPTAVGNTGVIINCKRTSFGSNVWTITSATEIENQTSITILVQDVNISLQSDGSQWLIV